MKHSNLGKIARAGIISLSLMLLPSTLPASAQTTGNDVESQQTSIPARTTPVQEKIQIDSNDGSILGAIGLICLALLTREYSQSGR